MPLNSSRISRRYIREFFIVLTSYRLPSFIGIHTIDRLYVIRKEREHSMVKEYVLSARQLIFPISIHARVSLVLDAGAPHRLISGGHRARHEQVPSRSRLIAFHLDMAIQAVMDREGEDPGRSAEEAPDRLAPFEPAQTGAFP